MATSRPTTDTATSNRDLTHKTRDLIARTEGVRHLSAEIQTHIRNTFLSEPETTRTALSLTFVSSTHVKLDDHEKEEAVRNPSPTLQAHHDLVSVLSQHVTHMSSSGEVARLGIMTAAAKPTLKHLLLELHKRLESLKVDIKIYANLIEEELSTSAVSLSDTFITRGNSLYNETLRAFGVADDIETAMVCLNDFYKANEKALVAQR